jgi:hypothetical protein
MAGGRPLKFKTVSELQEAIDAYYRSCWDYVRDMFGNRIVDKQDPSHSRTTPAYIMKKVRPYTVTGMAVALDTTRDTLIDYEHRDKFSDTIKRAKLAIYADTEEMLYGKGTATGAIFSLKNNYGWVDKQLQDLTTNGKDLPVPILGGVTNKGGEDADA